LQTGRQTRHHRGVGVRCAVSAADAVHDAALIFSAVTAASSVEALSAPARLDG